MAGDSEDKRPELDRTLTDRAQGGAEQAALGTSPYGSMVRIAVFVLAFVVIGGLIFSFLT